MNRLRWCIVPLLMSAIALFSFSFLQKQIKTLQSDLMPLQNPEEIEKTWNRPTAKKPLISNTLVICLTGYPQNTYQTFHNWLLQENVLLTSAKVTHANTNDEAYLLYQLLSGQQENNSDTHSVNGYHNSDSLVHLASYYGIHTTVLSSLPEFPLEKPGSIELELKASGIPSNPNQFTLLHINAARDDISSEQIQQWIKQYQEKVLEGNLSKQILLCFIPTKKTNGISWIRNSIISSSYLYWNSLKTKNQDLLPKINLPMEDLTATLSFGLGFVPPTGCLGKPVGAWFQTLEEADLMDRFLYHTDQIIFSTIYHLNHYKLEDSIVAGYLIEAEDTMHATASASFIELERRYQVILDEFNSFHLYHQKKINMLPSLLFTLLALLCLLVWLYNWLTRFRSYTFGVALFLLFVLVQRYGFPARLSFPAFSTLSVWGIVLNQLLFILPILSMLILGFTLLAGYWFDIPFEEICLDINGIFISFSVCLLLFMAIWVNRFGFVHLSMMPPLGVQQNQFQHLSLWILMPVLLGFSYALSYGFTRLLMTIGTSHGKIS